MGKKINLPLLPGSSTTRTESLLKKATPDRKPSLDDARQRLGGRSTDEEPAPRGFGPGTIVRVVANDGEKHVAVVVFANATEIHVLVGGTKLRRVPPAAVERNAAPAPSSLVQIAADAQVFAGLVEGQPVRYADAMSALRAGKLVEKCRYGALIARDDGAVVAVGFRKLWPAWTSRTNGEA